MIFAIGANGFANLWHYPLQCRVGLEFNCNIPSCRLYWLKLQHPWPRRNIPYTALEPPNEICCLESTSNTINPNPGGPVFKTTGWLQDWQPFIHLRSIKWVPQISGNIVVKSKLLPQNVSSLKAVEPHP